MKENIRLGSPAKTIDHSRLHPTMTDVETLEGCETVRRYGVATVCVKSCAVTGNSITRRSRP